MSYKQTVTRNPPLDLSLWKNAVVLSKMCKNLEIITYKCVIPCLESHLKQCVEADLTYVAAF